MSEKYQIVFRGGVLNHTSRHPQTPEGEQLFVDEMLNTYGKDVVEQIYRTWGDRKTIYQKGV